MVFKNKTIDDVLHKNVEKRFNSENKKISQNVKNLFNLRVEIYKTLIIKYEESIAERVKLRRQKSEKKEWDQEYVFDAKEIETTDRPDLESEESAAIRKNQQGQGLKILTPNQMLSRLPISLAQLKAGNNSQKLKNEIRQLLYSLYRSKKLTKQLYKSLVDII